MHIVRFLQYLKLSNLTFYGHFILYNIHLFSASTRLSSCNERLRYKDDFLGINSNFSEKKERKRERGGKYVRKKRDKTLTYDGTFALRNKNDGVKRGTRF